jgi:SAM-dependent methyltransferase
MSSAMASLGRYHEYLWSFVHPWLGQRVLEVGVGFGQYTRRMLAEKRRVLGCDLDTGHLEALKVSAPSPLLETLRLDLEEPEASRAASAAFFPDSIILLNVLEHIRADKKALTFLREVAAPGGRIVVIVPALAVLYNGLDREAGHRRRYSRASLSRALGAAGWAVVTVRYINLPGIPGWLAAGWLSRASRSATELNAPSTNWLLRFYDRFFVGLSRLTDPLAARVAGLSVLAIARKQ